MVQRNLAVNLILTILTCGIYGIVWFITITDDASYASKDSSISGGIALLLTIVTCGIYSIYWNYKVGQMIHKAKLDAGLNSSNNAVLYLILGIFGFQIVNYCIMQSELNDIASI